MELGLKKQLNLSYDEALAALPEALKSEGFGVLTEIDVAETFKKKLGIEFRRYKILGACNPQFAHRALSAETDAGVMLPCNVIIYEGDNKKATVVAIDPMQTMAHHSPALQEIANTVRGKLQHVLERLP